MYPSALFVFSDWLKPPSNWLSPLAHVHNHSFFHTNHNSGSLGKVLNIRSILWQTYCDIGCAPLCPTRFVKKRYFIFQVLNVQVPFIFKYLVDCLNNSENLLNLATPQNTIITMASALVLACKISTLSDLWIVVVVIYSMIWNIYTSVQIQKQMLLNISWL